MGATLHRYATGFMSDVVCRGTLVTSTVFVMACTEEHPVQARLYKSFLQSQKTAWIRRAEMLVWWLFRKPTFFTNRE